MPYHQPLIRNLGKLAGMLIALVVAESEAHDDVDAFHAPSECHGDVARGFRRDAIALVESIEQATGYSLDEIEDELQKRCSGKWLWNSGIWAALHDVKEHRERQADAKQYLRWRQRPRLV